MKNVISVFLFSMLCLNMFGQSLEQKLNEQDRRLLTQALESGDYQTAATASQSLLVRDKNNLGIIDTLVLLYKIIGNQQGILYMTKRIIEADPGNLKALENHASAAKKLKQHGEAITTYNRLYQIEGNTKYLYEIAALYYGAKDEVTGEKVMQQIINSPRGKTDLIEIVVSKGQTIEVPVLAVAYNYLGYLNFANDKKEDAKFYFNKSLEVFPDFILAKNNLDNLKKK